MNELLLALCVLLLGILLNVCTYKLSRKLSILKPFSNLSRFLILELFTVLLILWAYRVFGFNMEFFKSIFFISILVIVSFIDYYYQIIPDKILLWLAGVGILLLLLTHNPLDKLMGSILGGILMLLIAMTTRGGMGGGDIKFIAAIGLWLGVKFTFLTIFLSFLIGGFVSLLLIVSKQKSCRQSIPFGPFIAISAFVILLHGNTVLKYLIR